MYYEESYEYLKTYISDLKKFDITVFFCLRNNVNIELVRQITNDFPTSYQITTPNVGKDIGGKLALIDLVLKIDFMADYYILIHDKKSPYSSFGEVWRQKLYRIIEPNIVGKILAIFLQERSVGVVATKEFIESEYDEVSGSFKTLNDTIQKGMIESYHLKMPTYEFVGGTMFWVRSEIFNKFFLKFSPLEIRKLLERGDVLDNRHGTFTHSWERMFSWIAADQGYKIKGI